MMSDGITNKTQILLSNEEQDLEEIDEQLLSFRC
jgi:hypothetical protein